MYITAVIFIKPYIKQFLYNYVHKKYRLDTISVPHVQGTSYTFRNFVVA